jgi:hypothetical protein
MRGSGRAALAVQREDAEDGRVDRGVQVGVGEDDGRALPPSSIDRPFRNGRGVAEDDLAGAALAGERDERHVGVLHERVAGVLAEAVDEVEDALGQARLFEDARPEDADSGVNSAGFSTTVLPVASAGPSFHDSSMNGVFHGVMRPATPIGLRLT